MLKYFCVQTDKVKGKWSTCNGKTDKVTCKRSNGKTDKVTCKRSNGQTDRTEHFANELITIMELNNNA